MNSWRVSEHILPVSVRKPIAHSHSASVGRISRTKACRCRTRASLTSFTRGEVDGAKQARTAAVIVSSLKLRTFAFSHRLAVVSRPAEARRSVPAAASYAPIPHRPDAG